jgi:hypothetical protein
MQSEIIEQFIKIFYFKLFKIEFLDIKILFKLSKIKYIKFVEFGIFRIKGQVIKGLNSNVTSFKGSIDQWNGISSTFECNVCHQVVVEKKKCKL